MRESINCAVFLSFKLSSTVSLTHSYSQLAHPLTYILIKLQTLWRAKERCLLLISVMAELQSSVTCSPAKWSCSHNSESTDAIPPLTTVWTAVAEWRCPCLFSLTPRAEEANQRYLWSIFIHEQWVNETKGFVTLCLWQVTMHMAISDWFGNQSRGKINADGRTDFSSFYGKIYALQHLFDLFNKGKGDWGR